MRAWAAWYWHRWRARRDVHRAALDYRHGYDPDTLGRLIRAETRLRQLEWNPPR